jgi:hypothetical protein
LIDGVWVLIGQACGKSIPLSACLTTLVRILLSGCLTTAAGDRASILLPHASHCLTRSSGETGIGWWGLVTGWVGLARMPRLERERQCGWLERERQCGSRERDSAARGRVTVRLACRGSHPLSSASLVISRPCTPPDGAYKAPSGATHNAPHSQCLTLLTPILSCF